MTPEAQRVAIAEACGWTKIYKGPEPDNRWMMPDGKHYATDKDIPDYLNDLNAMHEAEKILPTGDNCDGCGTSSLDYYDSRISPRSTAAQRAEAFLRTVGKWEKEVQP